MKRILLNAFPVLILCGFLFFVLRHAMWSWRDGSDWYNASRHQAQGWASDSELIQFEGALITSDGLAQKGGSWRFVFQSKARYESRTNVSSSVPGQPPMPDQRPKCRFEFAMSPHAGKGGMIVEAYPSENCRKLESPLAPPRCSVREVWSRAVTQGAPATAWANISYRLSGGTPMWTFAIFDRAKDRSKPMFSAAIPDDCSSGK